MSDEILEKGESLTIKQITILLFFGVFYWFLAALAIRYGSPLGWFDGLVMMVHYIVVFPAAWIVVRVSAQIAGLAKGQMLKAAVIMLTIATFFDGVHLVWFRSLYGENPVLILNGAGLILWGVGAVLTVGIVQDARVGQ
jgi:hypothetical protein